MSSAVPLQIQFLGVDEGADPKNLPPGTLLRAENLRMPKPRRLETRLGVAGLAKTRADAGSIATGKRLVAYPQGNVGVSDGQDVFNRNEQSGTWCPVDRVTNFTVTSRALAEASRSVTNVDVVISGSLLFAVLQTGTANTGTVPGRLYLQVENLDTGQTVKLPQLIPVVSGYTNPRIVLGAAKAFIVWSEPGVIAACPVDLSTYVLGARVALASDAIVSPNPVDAVIGTSSAGEALYVAYELAAGADRIQVRSFLTSSLAADQSATAAAGTGLGAVCLAYCPLASRVALIYSSSSLSLINATVFDRDLTTTTAVTAMSGASRRADNVFIAEDSATHAVFGYQVNASYGALTYDLFTAKTDFAALG